MKISKQRLIQIIKEEIASILKEEETAQSMIERSKLFLNSDMSDPDEYRSMFQFETGKTAEEANILKQLYRKILKKIQKNQFQGPAYDDLVDHLNWELED